MMLLKKKSTYNYTKCMFIETTEIKVGKTK